MGGKERNSETGTEASRQWNISNEEMGAIPKLRNTKEGFIRVDLSRELNITISQI